MSKTTSLKQIKKSTSEVLTTIPEDSINDDSTNLKMNIGANSLKKQAQTTGNINKELNKSTTLIPKGETQLRSVDFLHTVGKQKTTTLVSKRKTLVLDLDETLIHSSFEPIENYSFTLPIMQDGVEKKIYVGKRPFVDEFLKTTSKIYDIVIFTAGLKSYADPVIDQLDVNKVCKRRFFRDSCIYFNGYYIKDLTIVTKSLKDVIIIDNSPACYCLNPNNAIPILSWFDDSNDIELFNLLPLLDHLSKADDVTKILSNLTKEGFEIDEQ
ncbi:RNA polymerase II carboxyterminal domain phosphatase [Theileria orientalis strain Shintoku]|uniref:RNA polymerase II carboxyterminal domain phosphatase n=1 Tax=Theileria orientalis strain Shintoku TaxID=869250 RepID=J4DQ00_THEOR|nr:RNA polymerase II carboxyterminal domain phosphatase [Theileria orientalis strain Shintoku]PVC54575.1 RNA polymerase II carboxyterminal domain phosphatase [Theileria orientalis]BAM41589.1 RNA polymerase II carboxyterminal domain phosphatase [Theileria orientalis strain Shintoku]|eukprot:XP_009691890.1 RNA polymerase II carboxyterminal domain phosphatase [Theileria orientalis strain Shintoku]